MRAVSQYDFILSHRHASLAKGCLADSFHLRSVSNVVNLHQCVLECSTEPKCGAVALYEVRGTRSGRWASETERMGFCALKSKACLVNATMGTCRPWGSNGDLPPLSQQGWCAFVVKPPPTCPARQATSSESGSGTLVVSPQIPPAAIAIVPDDATTSQQPLPEPLFDGSAHTLGGGLNNMIMHLAQLIDSSNCLVSGSTLLLPRLDADPLATLGVRSGTVAWLERTGYSVKGGSSRHGSSAAPLRRGQLMSASACSPRANRRHPTCLCPPALTARSVRRSHGSMGDSAPVQRGADEVSTAAHLPRL